MSADLWFKLLDVLVEVVITLVGTYAIAWLRTRLRSDQLAKAVTIAEMVVPAVEQVFAYLHGPEKLAQAVVQAKTLATSHGVNLTDEQWQTLIEQAVYRMNQATKALKTSATEKDA